MSDKPTPGTVPLNDCCVPQHKRMAAGEKVTGQTLPPAKAAGSKTPA